MRCPSRKRSLLLKVRRTTTFCRWARLSSPMGAWGLSFSGLMIYASWCRIMDASRIRYGLRFDKRMACLTDHDGLTFLRGFSDCARAYRSWITFTSMLYRNLLTRIRRASSLGGHRRNLQRTSSLLSMRSCKASCEVKLRTVNKLLRGGGECAEYIQCQ